MLVYYSACLAIGNLVIEEVARDTFLGIAMSVRALSEQLKSRDRLICVLILLHVSSYCYVCVLILLYMCPHTAVGAAQVVRQVYICVLILLHMCPRTAIYVSSYCYVCVLILLHMCPQLCYICDRFLVRYATGAIRNVAVDGKVLSLVALLVLY